MSISGGASFPTKTFMNINPDIDLGIAIAHALNPGKQLTCADIAQQGSLPSRFYGPNPPGPLALVPQ
jgi:hypothetical protein